VSKAFAQALGDEFVADGLHPTTSPLNQPQTIGSEFARVTKDFLNHCYKSGFQQRHPGDWDFQAEATLSNYYQFAHLRDLENPSEKYRGERNYGMAAVVSGDYHVTHDVLTFRMPESIEALNERAGKLLLDEGDTACEHTPLLLRSQENPIVHAAVSAKWTLRSDRAQNVRTEAFTLQRHRRGRTPHLVAVTADPLPTRLASVALGKGEIACVYTLRSLSSGRRPRNQRPKPGSTP
jgi:hypothetical protein